eukprot:m.30152 g.30152  ORF g.30152 m.30152 type:complete len:648 (-) comp9370_c0_seq1:32-1975(-)
MPAAVASRVLRPARQLYFACHTCPIGPQHRCLSTSVWNCVSGTSNRSGPSVIPNVEPSPEVAVDPRWVPPTLSHRRSSCLASDENPSRTFASCDSQTSGGGHGGGESGFARLKREAVVDAYLRGILDAQSVVYDVARETDLQYASSLSALLENNVYFKREDQQPVHSFKIRGAYNKIVNLTNEERNSGIVACSAGNHAQGVALSAHALGVDAIIVMPRATPNIKVDAVRKFGGNVLLHGLNYDEAQAEARRLAAKGRVLIHPFDDPLVICGQGTIGMEILKQLPSAHKQQLDAVFCCVGGGGLLAGVSTYIKKVLPEVKMVGVEAKDAAGMTASLELGAVATLPHVGLFADGASVRTVGSNTFGLVKELVDGMVTVDTDEICAAIKTGFNDTRCVLEPAGALGIAGLVRYVQETGIKGRTLVCVASGANMDFDRLRFVSERADSSENLVAVQIPDRKGEFWRLYSGIFPRNVTEFSFRAQRSSTGGAAGAAGGDTPAATSAAIILNFQTSSPQDRAHVLSTLRENEGYSIMDLQDNDLAKTHLRHLIGGRAALAAGERLFRFEFPERPGALREFLQRLNGDDGIQHNITLFHYRNHGADVGRVLVGIEDASDASTTIDDFLASLGFVFVEETHNHAYKQFLLEAASC